MEKMLLCEELKILPQATNVGRPWCQIGKHQIAGHFFLKVRVTEV